MRLTDKVGVDYIYSNFVSLNEPHKSIANKLGQLEDIEDELGIDLITLFKASKGIDIDEGNAIRENVIPTIDLLNKRFIVATGVYGFPYKTYYFKDYGKTWALTKEELQ